jgi:uncharacterized protein YbjT (DUF2867 family)
MANKTVTIIGVTGLIGGHLLSFLEHDREVETIRILVRRPVDFSNLKTETRLINFNDEKSFKLAVDGSDVVFCAVGTTQKKVKGDKEAYRRVDYDIPVKAARYCRETGCEKFMLVSSVGADSKSGSFYLQLKGKVEEAIMQTGIKQIGIFRPSILLGRRPEKRPGEKIGQVLMQAFRFLLAGPLKKYKPFAAKDVALAMIIASKHSYTGTKIFQYAEMKSLLPENTTAFIANPHPKQ